MMITLVYRHCWWKTDRSVREKMRGRGRRGKNRGGAKRGRKRGRAALSGGWKRTNGRTKILWVTGENFPSASFDKTWHEEMLLFKIVSM